MEHNDFTISKMSKVDFSIYHISGNASLHQTTSHIHKECEIYLNINGNVSFEVENHIYPVKRGSVIITRPYEYHHCIQHSNENHEHFWITFSAEETENFLEMFFNRRKGKNNLITLTEEKLNELCDVMWSLIANENDLLKRRIDFLRLFQIISGGRQESYQNNEEYLPDDVRTALRYMEEHLTEKIDIATLCDFCNVSVNTLERHFKEALGLSPFSMLRKKRLIASLQYLRYDDSVAEAALKSGFSDYSNYIQLFRKQFGMTPLKYKKQFDK